MTVFKGLIFATLLMLLCVPVMAGQVRITACAPSPDGRRMAIAFSGNTVSITKLEAGDIAAGPSLARFSGHGAPIVATAFSRDGLIATGSEDGTATIWNRAGGEALRVLSGHGGPVRAVAFSADGKSLLTGSDDKTVRIWGSENGKLIRSIGMHAEVTAVAIAPDGRHAVIGMRSEQPEIWDIAAPRLVDQLYGHAGSVQSVSFSPDGRRIASSAQDGSVIIWDSQTAQESWRIVEPGAVGQVFYIPNTDTIALLSDSGTLKVIDPSGQMPRKLRTRAEKVALLAGVGVVWLAAVMVVFVMIAVTVQRGKRKRTPIRFKVAVLGAVLMVVMIVPVIEVGLRLVLDASYNGDLKRLPPVPPENARREIEYLEIVKLDPNPKIGYTCRPNISAWFMGCRIMNNSLGYRDDPVVMPKPPRTIRVLGVGDSTTWGYGVSTEENYLNLLEAEFNRLLRPEWNVEFINTGASGYNTTQEAEALITKGLKLDPDAVIVQFDSNDLQSILTYPKPDFLFARIVMMAHLPAIARGEASDPRAFYLLYQKDLLGNTGYSHTGWSAVERGYRAIAQACRERKIPVFGLTLVEYLPDPDRPDRSVQQRVVDLWRRLGITPMDALPVAIQYLKDNNLRDTRTIINSETDHHPNRVGHALIARAILPHMYRFMAEKSGVEPDRMAGGAAPGDIIVRQMTQ